MKKKVIILTILILLIALTFIFIYIKTFVIKDNSGNSWINETASKDLNLLQVYQCNYNGNIVYHFVHGCCDFFDYVYNSAGEKICTFGGISGHGDGSCLDFFDKKEDCNIVWQQRSK